MNNTIVCLNKFKMSNLLDLNKMKENLEELTQDLSKEGAKALDQAKDAVGDATNAVKDAAKSATSAAKAATSAKKL